jgi:protein-disulfide isomerase
MSGKTARRRRKQAAAPPPVARKGERRRASPRILFAALVGVLVVAGAAVGIALAVGGGGSSSPGTARSVGSLTNALPEADLVQREFAGIPQQGLVLGSPKASATLIEYIDLQCPFCRDFETQVLPSIVKEFVRTGKLKIVARPVHFIGPDSLPARNAAIAAGYQGRAFNFMQVIYLNQQPENTGWLNHDFIEHAAASVPGMDVRRVLDEQSSSAVKAAGAAVDAQANAAQLIGTPTIFLGRTGSKPKGVSSSVTFDVAKLAAAIRSQLR